MSASLIRQTMKVTKETQQDGTTIFVCHTQKVERFLPKAAGFKWNGRWETPKASNAAKLREYADGTCIEELAKRKVLQSALDKIELAHVEVEVARIEYERWRADEEARALARAGLAEVKKNLLAAVPAGNYIVDIHGKRTVLQVRVSVVGNQYLKDENGEYLGFCENLLRALAAENLELASRRYGQETGRCRKCNQPLGDPIAMFLGIGPDCGRDEHKAYKATLYDNGN